MQRRKFWKARTSRKQTATEIEVLDGNFPSLETSLRSSIISDNSMEEIQEMHLTLSKIIGFYNIAKRKVSENGSVKALDKFHNVKDTILTQKTITKTLLKLAEQGCATQEEISTTKKQGILIASKIENEIMRILIELRPKGDTQPIHATYKS